MSKAELLSVGSLVIDHINDHESVGGASANVAVNTSILGHSASLLTALSREETCTSYVKHLSRQGVRVHSLPTSLSQLPRCTIKMDASGKQESFEWFGNGVEALFQNSTLDTELIRNTPVVYLAICETVYALKVSQALQDSQILSYNPGSRVFESIDHFRHTHQRADYIFLNEAEYGHLVREGYVLEPQDLIIRPNQVALLTAGKKNTRLVTAEGIHTFTPESVTAIDETGAGDSFASAFLWARAQSYPFETCVRLGNLLASYVVQQVGCQINETTRSQFMTEAKKRSLVR